MPILAWQTKRIVPQASFCTGLSASITDIVPQTTCKAQSLWCAQGDLSPLAFDAAGEAVHSLSQRVSHEWHLPARRENQIGKTDGRWYLPKLHYWLAFSSGNAISRDVARRTP